MCPVWLFLLSFGNLAKVLRGFGVRQCAHCFMYLLLKV
ncbi:hypothetical protein AQPE_1607 [Aquipluma nitroreducens]|uniref:Uncharacterized protein n=1 Tax=Aquipluma nitroreducens TaxID=2010828 RepID=A0A5K7S7I0_9BACT|nr:hypothetical protein AQPE_1607 [Aquipluma nitroreducens]